MFIGVINAMDIPARQSFLVEMVERKDDLGSAIALNSSLVNGARLIGPSIAGIQSATDQLVSRKSTTALNDFFHWEVVFSFP